MPTSARCSVHSLPKGGAQRHSLPRGEGAPPGAGEERRNVASFPCAFDKKVKFYGFRFSLFNGGASHVSDIAVPHQSASLTASPRGKPLSARVRGISVRYIPHTGRCASIVSYFRPYMEKPRGGAAGLGLWVRLLDERTCMPTGNTWQAQGKCRLYWRKVSRSTVPC